jgi:tetratricopeptide (TPR) repeat protein
VTVPVELERARHLALAADEESAKDLLLSLGPQIEQADRDDWLLEVYAQLGELYLVRTAYDGVVESVRRIRECLATYERAGEARHMVCRYARRAQFLETGLAAAHGEHERAAAGLNTLRDMTSEEFPDLVEEHEYVVTYARLLCAIALCDDDLYAQSVPLWEPVIAAIEKAGSGELQDNLRVLGATAYGRFCVETGRLAEAEPWLQRAGARAEALGWELAAARTQLERGAASWAARDHLTTEKLVSAAYPVIAKHLRANDVSRCWLYFGLTRLGAGSLEGADHSWEQAEKHWREIEKPLHIHRILLQRSWVDIYEGRFADAIQRVAQAREMLDSWPRASWLQHARLDDHLGTIWRADALADLGFSPRGDQVAALGVITAEVGSAEHTRAMAKLEQAADLKLPAALAVDSVRYSITDADARMRWATTVSARILAGAFAVAWEWENTALITELIEYHAARGAFSADPTRTDVGGWAATATAAVPVESVDEYALVAAGPATNGGPALTRLGPLPELLIDPASSPVLSRYRALAFERYGQTLTANEPAWSTWP